MRIIKDSNGLGWTIKLTIGSAKKLSAWLEQSEGVDFFNAAEMAARLGSVVFCVDFLYFHCEEQAKERGIDARAFGESFWGKEAFESQRALFEEYADFFPDPAIQNLLRDQLEKITTTSKREQDLFRRVLEREMASYQQKVENMERIIFSDGSSNTPDLPELDPNTKTSPIGNYEPSPKPGTNPPGTKPARSRSSRGSTSKRKRRGK